MVILLRFHSDWVPIFEKVCRNTGEERMLKLCLKNIMDMFKTGIRLFLVNTSSVGRYFLPISINYLHSFLHG